MQNNNRIELLAAKLLEQEVLANQLNELAAALGVPLGWHYLLDLIWMARNLDTGKERITVLDAGAGTGLAQWYLARLGADVISVDRSSRKQLAGLLRSKFSVRGLRGDDDLAPSRRPPFTAYLPPRLPRNWPKYGSKLANTLQARRLPMAPAGKGSGTVYIYNHDLSEMQEVKDASVDAIVSISALEHNQPENLPLVVAELMRVLKPGGKLVATVAAARNEDWFHEPSKGWVYSETTLKRLFDLGECQSNFSEYNSIFDGINNSDYLRTNLADFYFESAENGMPWGKWAPAYQPVGIVKVKGE